VAFWSRVSGRREDESEQSHHFTWCLDRDSVHGNRVGVYAGTLGVSNATSLRVLGTLSDAFRERSKPMTFTKIQELQNRIKHLEWLFVAGTRSISDAQIVEYDTLRAELRILILKKVKRSGK